MTNAHEVTDVDLNSWPPGTRFFSADDGSHFVVCADLASYPSGGNVRTVRQPTAILFTSNTAWPDDMTPDFSYPPGTTHEDAVAQAGYELS